MRRRERMQLTKRRGHSGDAAVRYGLKRAVPGVLALCVVTAAAATSSTVSGDEASAPRAAADLPPGPSVSVVLPTLPQPSAPVTATPAVTRSDADTKVADDASVADIP